VFGAMILMPLYFQQVRGYSVGRWAGADAGFGPRSGPI
jgi:hypothetical protein